MEKVTTVTHDGWAEMVLNRPERRNAIDGELGIALADCARALAADDAIRVIVFRGAEGAFCSGLDLKAFNADPPPEWLPRFGEIWRGAHRALYECSKPIIVAFERYGINGGAALCLAGDLVVAGETAFLQVGEVRQGMAAPYNIAWLRLRHSESVTAKLTLTGRRFLGPELVDLGIAYDCVADQAVVERAHALAAELAEFPDGALARIKQTMRAYNAASADTWFDRATSVDPVKARPAPRAVD